MSYAETMRRIQAELPNIEGLLEYIEMGEVFIEVSDNWFRKYDIAPRGIQMLDRMCWLISRDEFEEIIDSRPGPKRLEGVGYRWKEVY